MPSVLQGQQMGHHHPLPAEGPRNKAELETVIAIVSTPLKATTPCNSTFPPVQTWSMSVIFLNTCPHPLSDYFSSGGSKQTSPVRVSRSCSREDLFRAASLVIAVIAIMVWVLGIIMNRWKSSISKTRVSLWSTAFMESLGSPAREDYVAFLRKGVAGKGKDTDKVEYFDRAEYFDKAE